VGRRPEFYDVYFGLIVVATALVLAPGTPLGVLTNAVQTLAGVLLPCLVTALTIAREQSWRFAAKLLTRQALAASVFAATLAWCGGLMGW